jgi:exonuclease III
MKQKTSLVLNNNKFYKYKLLLLVFVVILLNACNVESKQNQEQAKDQKELYTSNDNIIFCTFNIAWLGDGINDKEERNDSDYQNIASILKEINADIFALQEIENIEALNKVLKFLPGYKAQIFDVNIPQNCAILYKKKIKIKNPSVYFPLQVDNRNLRPGLLFEAKKGNFDFKMMVVHLKSTSGYDNTEEKREKSFETRKKQDSVMTHWIDSTLKSGKEKDLIICGDFNDNPLKEKHNLIQLAQNSNMTFLNADLLSCKNPKWKIIDHFVVSNSVKTRYNPSSLYIYDLKSAFTEEEVKKLSDHCPLVMSLEIKSPDND